MNKSKLYISATALAVSLGLATNTAIAQDNAPVKVNSIAAEFESQLSNRLGPVFSDRGSLERKRYIITYKADASNQRKGDGSNLYQRGETTSNSDLSFDIASAKSQIMQLGGVVENEIAEMNMMVATLDKRGFDVLSNSSAVASIEEDQKRYMLAQSTPYGYSMVQANRFAQNNTTARKVCVIDSGYNLGHPDLPDSNNGVTGQANNNQVGNWFNDGSGHGTHVAGTIAAYDNTQGVIGVYPGVSLHIVKVFNDSGNWTFASDLIAAINQCQNAGANVVNMSLGGGAPSNTERNAMQGFADDGILLVAAAGNGGDSSMSYPASYDAVMSVAAVDSNENRASYSQYNSQVEIAAPGSSVNSTYPTNTYARLSGTSMASPHVAGGAALVWSYFPQCSNTQIRNALNASAKDKGASGRDTQYGHGLLQLESAYNYLNANGCGGGTDPDPGVDPVSGQLNGLSGSTGSWDRYTWSIPEGVTTMTLRISGGSGDADLYVRYGSEPQTNSFDCRPYASGNNEVCTFDNPASGTWHIGIRAYSSYNNVTLQYSYE